MSEFKDEAEPSSLNLNDILFIFFRHKWRILLCAGVGLAAAAAVYFLFPPLYESEAKLLVRYVVERSTVDKLEAPIKTPGSQQNDNLINSEVEILTSSDVTLPMASFMDKVLLVVEAEKSSWNAVKRAYTQLAAKTDVWVVFNKSRSYGLKWLEGEL